MTKEEIEHLMHLSITELMEIAKTQEGFIKIINCAIKFGKLLGLREAHESMNKALRQTINN